MDGLHGRRGGNTFDEARDASRLNQQATDVWAVMRDGAWHGLAEISNRTGHPEASISARLRDFRKARFGGHEVLREHRARGLWAYKLVPAQTDPADQFGVADTLPV